MSEEEITLHNFKTIYCQIETQAQKELAKARAKNKRLRAALEKLSNKDNYGCSSYEGIAQIFDGENYIGFPWDIAKKALEELG